MGPWLSMCSSVAINSPLGVHTEVEKWRWMMNIRSVVCKCIPGGAAIVVDVSWWGIGWCVKLLKLQRPELAASMAPGR